MPDCELLICNARVLDGSGAAERECSVAVACGRILSMDASSRWDADQRVEAEGLVLAPGFIDTHIVSGASDFLARNIC